MGEMKLVVGLGNPGDEYINTRHNMGFLVIDSLSTSLDIEVRRRKFGARFGSGEYAGRKLILLKPWQFMNRSGQAVATAAGFYRLDPCDLLVITDDMDLEPGRIRVRAKGSAGGHNGLADIIAKLGTSDFARCRIGIGRSVEEDAVDHVLDKPSKEEQPLLEDAIKRAREAALCWVEFGTERTMNEFNRFDG
jgi:PTH1 family peptidyl-tRNA hydrolase